jgi:dolichyl-phosphate-mannose-protein mannosyltransferase
VTEIVHSRIDLWWAQAMSTPRRRALWHWGAPAAVLLLAAVSRLWGLGSPHTLVFDETFYVKDAWTLWNLGYEATWDSNNPDLPFNAGDVMGFTTHGSYVVHPPLGKWLIGLGIVIFGPQNAFGWRIATALAGILMVLLTMLIAKRLTRSTLITVIAGGLLAIDGVAIVLSRVSVLDNFLALFALLGAWFVLLDRQRPRLTLWRRPYLLLAGFAFGLACSVKWSGIYFLAVFAVYVVVMDALDRRKDSQEHWLSDTIIKNIPVKAMLMVPIAAVTYLASWTGWIVTRGGYGRSVILNDPSQAWTGWFSWVPEWFQALWAYHVSAYTFHVGLHTPHPYQSNPLTWPLLLRPTSMYYQGTTAADGCFVDSCSSLISPIGNPLIWWAGVIAVLVLAVQLVRVRDWRWGFVLLGIVAGYLPWLMYQGRTVFQFYSIAYEPYLVLALAMAIGMLLGRTSTPPLGYTRRWQVVAIYGAACVLISLFFFPLWSGMVVPHWFWNIHMWLPGWV